MATTNFKGFKQVLLETYQSTSDEEKKNYLWLVRDKSGDTFTHSAIYFGTRLYAEVNEDAAVDQKVADIITSLGDMIDENGEWLGFLPVEEHEILGNSGVTNVTDALSALEAAILSNADAIAGKVSQADFDAKVAELEQEIANLSADTVSAITEDIEEIKDELTAVETSVENLQGELDEANSAITANADAIDAINEELKDKAGKDEVAAVDEKVDELADSIDAQISAITEELDTKANADDVYTKDEVYTKEEVDAKVVGAFHFKGEASAVSADETTITLPNGDEVVASAENEGFVYQIGEFEYASNGSKWVKLGFNIDLSDYATKEYVEDAVSAETVAREALEERVETVEGALAEEIQAREDLAEEVGEIKDSSTTTAATYSDAEEMDLKLGQIVYVTTEETVSGITYMPGAYIYTQDGLKKLDSTTPSTSTTLEERVDSLENRAGELEGLVGNEQFEGDSLTAAVAALQNDTTHVIDGDDVEI